MNWTIERCVSKVSGTNRINSIPFIIVFVKGNMDRNTKQVTFVTAYYTLESTPYFEKRPDEWNPAPIFELAKSGIQLCLYIGKNCKFEQEFKDLEKECQNFRLMSYRVYYKNLWTYREIGETTRLPQNRNLEKDTIEYMVYMHSRHEIIANAISENTWNSTHFAWIDFNSPKLFQKKEESFAKLREIAHYPFPKTANYFAGCWAKLDAGVEIESHITDTIHWRFLGAFFLGSAESFAKFADLYHEKFPEFVKKTGVFPWEVNFWAWLEATMEWTPTWFSGDHNDNMLNIFRGVSADTYATPLHQSSILSKKEYTYPAIEPFLPGSASYVEHLGKHYLNTRFVNYWMYPNGYYRFHSEDMVIENRNFCSLLDPLSLEPVDFSEMNEMTLIGVDGNLLEKPERAKRTFSVGLEDIRLFSANDRIRFIATNVEYSPVSKNRMVLGTYDLETFTYRDCQVLIPPDENSWCEKNWIPVLHTLEDGTREERFIYKWSPMEIGRVDPSTNQLQIIQRHEIKHWLFSKLRGSTTFIDAPLDVLPKDLREDENGQQKEYLVGLAHFSEEHSPRHYYHLLILLEKQTLKPVRMSHVFYFEKLTIEFCIGMTTRVVDGDARYVFWISRFDRDPICINVRAGAFIWSNVC